MSGDQASPPGDLGGKAFYMFVGNWVALAALIPMVIAGLMLSFLFIDRAERDDVADLQRIVGAVSREVAAYLDSNIAIARSVAEAVRLYSGPNPGLIRSLPELIVGQRETVLSMAIADAEGTVVGASPDGASPPSDLARLSRQSPARFSTLRQPAGGDPQLAVAVPIRDTANAYSGAVYLEFSLAPLIALGREIAGQDMDFRLLDAAGHEVVLSAHVATGAAAESVLLADRTLSNGFVVSGRRHVQTLGLRDWGEYAVAACLLLLASMVSWLVAQAVAHRVSKPLAGLARDLAELNLEGGQQQLDVPDDAPREIRALFGEFNALLRRLDLSYGQLRESLEEANLLRRRMEHVLDERDAIISQRTADLQSRTAQLERANAALQRVATEDALTGVANRRAFDEFLALVWRLSLREHVPVSLILIDIDRFKSYNDHLGHQAGDDCLRQVAHALRGQAKRPLDLAARYGGEEFAIVLGRTDLAEAVDIAQMVRRAVETMRIDHAFGGISGIVTISLGVASMLPDETTEAEDLIAMADNNLYAAKDRGRNRVEFEFPTAPES